jgi:hypothetical protein
MCVERVYANLAAKADSASLRLGSSTMRFLGSACWFKNLA